MSTKHHEAKVEDVDRLAETDKRPAMHASTGFSPEEAEISRRVNRKMDFAMLPLLSLVYLFNGLDKGNIGNAETQGMCLFTKTLAVLQCRSYYCNV